MGGNALASSANERHKADVAGPSGQAQHPREQPQRFLCGMLAVSEFIFVLVVRNIPDRSHLLAWRTQ
jgi:hypothetical protein